MILIISSCKAFEKQTKTIKDQNNFVETGLADKFWSLVIKIFWKLKIRWKELGNFDEKLIKNEKLQWHFNHGKMKFYG